MTASGLAPDPPLEDDNKLQDVPSIFALVTLVAAAALYLDGRRRVLVRPIGSHDSGHPGSAFTEASKAREE